MWGGPGRRVFEGSGITNTEKMKREEFDACFETIAAAEHVLRFVRANKDKPFFVNFWLHETHHLVAATEEQKAPYPDTAEPQRTYFAAVTRADAQVGRVMALLDELKLADNTIVIFSSDNGPKDQNPNPKSSHYTNVGETGGLRGGKRVELYDLSKDRAQEHDMAADQPARVASMVAALKGWKATIPASPASASDSPKVKNVPKPKTKKGTPNFAKIFGRWDTDKDDSFTLKEYEDGHKNPGQHEARFKKLDRDGDGKVSRDEFVAPVGR